MALVSDVTTPQLSSLNHIDALLDSGPGWNWLTPSRSVIYYTFSVASGNQESNSSISGSVTAFNSAQQNACLSQLAYISQLTGITFALASSGTTADLHFANADIIAGANIAGLCGWSHDYRYYNSNAVTSYSAEAYVYLDNAEFQNDNANPTAGSSGYETLLHELGHALGLKHPFDGSPTLPSAENNTAYSIMAYTESGGQHSTFSPYDVAALMWLYGGDGLGGALGVSTSGKYITGSAEINVINGGSGNDKLLGLAGNDKLTGLAGNDVLDGGTGIDTGVYTTTRSNYAIAKTSAGFTVSGGTDGVDAISNVERLQFTDKNLALDLDANAGITAKILGAVFGASSVSNQAYVGIGLGYLDAGMNYSDLMLLALNARLGAGFSHAAEVNLLYQNLVGVLPSTNELNFYVGQLESGQHTQTSLATMAADLDLNASNINLVGLQQTGIEFS